MQDFTQLKVWRKTCVRQLFIARDLGFLSIDNFELLLNKIDEVSRMMIAFQKKLIADS